MPIYEYLCQSCGHKLEKLQRLSDPTLTDCPECKQSELRRLMSAAGFRLKGAGWYETDFKQDNKRNLAESTNGKEEGGTKSESSGDKKESGAKTESAVKSDGAAKTSSAGNGSGDKTSSAKNKTSGSNASDTA